MPKRAATPPPPEDEPRYLTVAYPYPPHANMELVQDCAEFSRWIACIVGKDPLLALFHKPSSPNMVIIEVDRSFGDWNSLLGEHRWSEVFRKCAPKDKDRVSQIFWCEFNTGRRVQKYGWKRVYVEEKWFTHWRVPNTNVAFPYPTTHWCDVPIEDRTNAPLCRPLPVASFPPPPSQTAKPSPVGSLAWVAAKEAPVIQISPKNAWGRGSPSALQSAPADSTQSSSVANSRNGSRAGSAWGGSSASQVRASSTNGLPPGLPPLNTPYSRKSDSSAWDDTPGLASAGGSGSGSEDNNSDVIGNTPPTSEAPEVFVAGDIEADMAELGIHSPPTLYDDDDFIPGIPADAVRVDEPVDPGENLWADYGKTEPQQASEEIVCPAHGKLCSRGICKEYNRLKREIERQKEAEERAAAQRERKKEKAKEKKSKAKNPVAEPSNKISYSVPFSNPQISNRIARAGSKSDVQNAWATKPTSTSTTASTAEATSGTTRARPAHLMKAASTQEGSGEGVTAPVRPARGRKMNSNPAPRTPIVDVPPKVTPRAGKGKAKMEDDTKSVASSTGGWGNISRGPWGGGSLGVPSVKDDRSNEEDEDQRTVNGSEVGSGSKGKGKGKSWADQMEEDDGRSVASGTSGWENVSAGPW